MVEFQTGCGCSLYSLGSDGLHHLRKLLKILRISKFRIDKNGVASTILENFDSADRRIFHVGRIFQSLLKEPLINLSEMMYAPINGFEIFMYS